ncbi:MAG: hypothetical protein ACRDGE_08715 [Candidatus Limnocylindria bacterium]
MAEDGPKFDPLGLLATLDRHRVAYIVIGAFGRVVQGAEEITRGVDIAPSTKPENLRRLAAALDDLDARSIDGQELDLEHHAQTEERVIELSTARGELKVVPEPTGTRGYDDLRRAATREPLGRGLRPSVASVDDLARMLAALGREEDQAKLRALRLLAELERGRGIEL